MSPVKVNMVLKHNYSITILNILCIIHVPNSTPFLYANRYTVYLKGFQECPLHYCFMLWAGGMFLIGNLKLREAKIIILLENPG